MATEANHIHNEALEGPLPEGFPNTGREGKVRNIYENGEEICLIASDRVSAFDQVSPTPIPGKGAILNDIARQELEAADREGIPTWLDRVPVENPRAAVGVRAEVLPAEIIFRSYMTGSMWREYRDTGDFAQFGLPSGWSEWHEFGDTALFTPSTKSDVKDVSFHPKDVVAATGIDRKTFGEMEEIGRALFELGTARAANRGLILVDTKYEIGRNSEGELIVIDEVHTPDSSRFVLADGFEEAVSSGIKPASLSKEFLRELMLDLAGEDVDRAKELMKEPLSDDVVAETRERYQRLHDIFTGK
jgi:phosphoribosylaminoimidazole-succinocarboxamide synthase